MKNIITTLVVCCILITLQAQDTQFYINGGSVTTSGGVKIVLNDVKFVNDGTFTAGDSQVEFIGTSSSTIGGTSATTFHDLKINKTSTDLQLEQNATVENEVDLASGKLVLGDYDLTMGNAASFSSNISETQYVQTNASGSLIRQVSTSSVLFPVGNTTFNPAQLTNQGTADNFSIRVLDNFYEDGLTGNIITEDVINRTWSIEESVAGGSDMTLRLLWLPTQEATGFTPAESYITYHDGTDWIDFSEGAAATDGTFTNYSYLESSGISNFSPFSVRSGRLITLSAKMFLEGAYSSVTGLMGDNLRSAGLVPLSEPYTSLSTFTHVNNTTTETTTAPVLAVTGDNAIVDWVFIELRDKTASSTVLATRSALVQKDGDVVDLDGVSPVTFDGIAADDYYIAVRHRNHLGAMTLNTMSLAKSPTQFVDFTNPTTLTYGTDAQADISGALCLIGGNADSNSVTRATGPSFINDSAQILTRLGTYTNIISSTYDTADVNMDGTIRATGPSFINDSAKLLSFLGVYTNIKTEQLP